MSNYRIIEIPEEITLTLKDIATALTFTSTTAIR